MIHKHGRGLYDVSVSPPHGNGQSWRSNEPMTVDEAVNKLIDLGCHTTDIGDAFYAADPVWVNYEGHARAQLTPE